MIQWIWVLGLENKSHFLPPPSRTLRIMEELEGNSGSSRSFRWKPPWPEQMSQWVGGQGAGTCRVPDTIYKCESRVKDLLGGKTGSLYKSECVCELSRFSRVWLCATLWTVTHQALLSMGFSRQEDWSGLPFPPPGDLPDPGVKLVHLLHRRRILHPLSHLGSPQRWMLLLLLLLLSRFRRVRLCAAP